MTRPTEVTPPASTLCRLAYHAASCRAPNLVCDQCGKTAEEASSIRLRACGTCYDVRYCSKQCQAAGHKEVCKARAKEREEKKPVNIVTPHSIWRDACANMMSCPPSRACRLVARCSAPPAARGRRFPALSACSTIMARRRRASALQAVLLVHACAAPAAGARLLASAPASAPVAAVSTAAPAVVTVAGPLAAAAALMQRTENLLAAEEAWTIPAPAPAPVTATPAAVATAAPAAVVQAVHQLSGTDSSSEHVAVPTPQPVAVALPLRPAATTATAAAVSVAAPAAAPTASVMYSWARFAYGSQAAPAVTDSLPAVPPPVLPAAAAAAPTDVATAPTSATGLKSLEFMSSMEGGVANPATALSSLGASSVYQAGVAATTPTTVPAVAAPIVTVSPAATAPAQGPLPNLIPFTPPLPAGLTAPAPFGFVRLTFFSPPPGSTMQQTEPMPRGMALPTPMASSGPWASGAVKVVATDTSPPKTGLSSLFG